ncbi:MAG: hypothetical protein SO072_13165, partial [Dysosmobacter sp.]|nr:hypothetical protein [Dysosmobacter sp.]
RRPARLRVASNSPHAIGRPYYALTRPRGTKGYARLMTTTGYAGGCVFAYYPLKNECEGFELAFFEST